MSQAWPVTVFETIDSTNTEAKRRAASGSFQNEWLRALQQTAGRGRLDRQWVSPHDNLYATALFSEPGDLAVAMRVPFAAGLAVCDAVVAAAPALQPRLKWPNDVRIDGAKIAGILIETGRSEGTLWIAAGIGINVASSPPDVGQAATSLSACAAAPIAADAVFDALRSAFATRLAQARAGFSRQRTDWLAQAEALGATVAVQVGEHRVEGIFEDLGEDGALLLRLPDGTQQTIRAGDVHLISQGSRDADRH